MAGKKQADNATNIWQALDAWSKDLDPWQRKIIAAAIDHQTLSEEEIKAVYAELLAPSDEKVELPTEERPENASTPLSVLRIDGLVGVNALRDDAALTFGPGLTAVFGRNGVGKSGFARVISNACFCRNTPKVVPNIYRDDAPGSCSADFHVQLGTSAETTLKYPSDEGRSVLKRIAVFDSSVAREVLSQTTEFEFRPRGFDVFTEMARVYAELAKLLDVDTLAKSGGIDFKASFIEPVTEISAAVSALSADTDLVALRALALYGDAERARLVELNEQLAALKARSPKAVLASLKEAKIDIEAIISKLRDVGPEFSDEAKDKRNQLSKAARNAAAAVLLLGSDTFKRPFFNAVGTPEWEGFAKAAHALGRKERADYPSAGDRCLLCEQPLGDAEQAHLTALFAFVEGDAQKTAASAKAAVDSEVDRVGRLQLPDMPPESRLKGHLNRLDPGLETSVSEMCGALSGARDEAVAAMSAHGPCARVIDVVPVAANLGTLVEKLDADIVRLEADDVEASIAAVDKERQTLRHREVLSQLMPQIEVHVGNLVWIRKANARRVGLSTRPITDKEKDLFNRFVTDAYRTRFAEECKNLDCCMPVELQTRGRSGQTVRSLTMPKGHKPNDILSEGEQKAVALADFLTEAALNPNSAGIVLDDPVTSQDFQRKQRIAGRLVEEAKERQVIVFTHDLVFLNQLLSAAIEQKIETTTHWVQVDANGNPGRVALGDTPYTEKTHSSTERAKQYLVEAKASAGKEQADKIILGMDALRTTLEVAVANRLLKKIVVRWEEQIRVPALRRVNWDNAKVEELCSLYEDISRYIGAHSHSDEASGAPPEPKDLESKLTAVEAIIKWANPDR